MDDLVKKATPLKCTKDIYENNPDRQAGLLSLNGCCAVYKIKIVREDNYNEITNNVEETAVVVENSIKKFKYKEDALAYFFRPRKDRDFCYGNNYLQDDYHIEIWEVDESGWSTFTLYKWEGFENDIRFEYNVKEPGHLYPLFNYKEFQEYLNSKNAYVYWYDDTYGHYGELRDNDDNETLGIEVECRY